MSWQVYVANRARKNLKKFPAKDRDNIEDILENLSFDPYRGDVDKLGGEENSWRRRTGNYRILFDVSVSDRIIKITDIERRSSKTY